MYCVCNKTFIIIIILYIYIYIINIIVKSLVVTDVNSNVNDSFQRVHISLSIWFVGWPIHMTNLKRLSTYLLSLFALQNLTNMLRALPQSTWQE